MVHPQEDRNDVLQQGREPDHQKDPARQAGRLPHAGEIIGRKEPPFQATGLDALSPLLMHVEFPATKEDVIARIGEAQIPIDRFRTERVAELLARLAPEEFPSSAELEQAFARVFTERGMRETRGSHHRQSDDVSGRPPN